MEHAKRNNVKVVVFVLLTVSILSFGLLQYNHSLRKDISQGTFETLNELLEQQCFNLSSRINADIKAAMGLANTVAFFPKGQEEALQLLNDLRNDTNFDYIVLSGRDGQGISSNGELVNISTYSYFQKALQGESALYTPRLSILNSSIVVPISTPIITNGVIKGVLIGVYDVTEINQLLLPSYGGRAVAYITDASGNIIVRPSDVDAPLMDQHETDNLLRRLEKADFRGYDSQMEIIDKMEQGESGQLTYQLDTVSYMMSYRALGVENWYVFMIVPEVVVSGQAKQITQKALLLTACIVSSFLLLISYIVYARRKTDRERAEHMRQLEHLAYYDPLCGLPMLEKFKELAESLLRAMPQQAFMLIKFDLVNLKVINKMFGFEKGNQVLQEIAQQLIAVQKEQGHEELIVSRIYADEFIMLDRFDGDFTEMNSSRALFEQRVLVKMADLLGKHRLEFRYGRYIAQEGELAVDSMVEKANLAHHLAKQQKSTLFCDYEESAKQHVLREIELTNRMQKALDQQEFKVYLQPKFDLKSERVIGAEALVRWLDPDSGVLIPPGEFIPLFERNGFVVYVDLYVYEQVCRMIRQWLDEGRTAVPISVNFSRLHLANQQLVQELVAIADRYGTPKQLLEIELTESVIYENEERLEEILQELHQEGFVLSMDDFGSGYSSLGLLKNLNVDVIKIDRSFFTGNKYKLRAKSVIESVMCMAKRLHIHTVAEGVETKEHIDLLKDVGCDTVQGFYYAKPHPAEELFLLYSNFITREEWAEDFLCRQAEDINREGSMAFGLPTTMYWLLQLAVRKSLLGRYGEEMTAHLLHNGGYFAGHSFARESLNLTADFDQFITEIEEAIQQKQLGVCHFERSEVSGKSVSVQFQTSLWHLWGRDMGQSAYHYEAGFLAGVLDTYTGREFVVSGINTRGRDVNGCSFELNEK